MVGCTDYDTELTSVADAKIQSFDENFRATFGTIAAGHDWGFGSSETARTRQAYTDGNMWGPSTEPNRSTQPYVVPAPLTQEQKDKVRDWFQTHNKPDGLSLSWTDFFVQQVYKGGTSPTGACPEVYTAKDGETSITGSEKMNYLTAGADNDHIYNFNWGTYSNNSETSIQVWNGTMDPSKGNDFNQQKVYYYDQITLMRSSSTSCFGYHESFIDKHYNDRFVIISGNTIDADIPGEPSVAGMYFVGFDFDADDTSKATSQQVDRDYYFSDWIVRITEGVLPSGSGGGSGSSSTTTYSYEETTEYHKITNVTQGRIICEDLGATTDSENNRRDIDYNDVVFDAYLISETYLTRYIKTVSTYVDGVYQGTSDNGSYDQTTSTNQYTKIVLQAAGGTIPLTVAGEEVHNKFGVDVDVMVNTVNDGQEINGRAVSGKAPVTFTTSYYSSLRDIPIAVRWSNDVIYLTAHEGGSPQKICVPINTPWCKERSSIDLGYPSFADWVHSNGAEPWYNRVQDRLYDRVPTATEMRSYNDEIVDSNSNSSQQSSTTYTVSPSGCEKSIWSDLNGSTVFPNDWASQSNSITLDLNKVAVNDNNNKAFGVGSKIRVYLHTNSTWAIQLCWRDTDDEWKWKQLMYTDNYSSQDHISGNDGYIEYTVTETSLAQIQKAGIVVQGINLIPLMVTVDNTNSTAVPATTQESFSSPTLASGESSVYSSTSGVELNSTGQTVTDGLSSAGENTEITVHGISDNGNISVTTSDGTALEYVSSSARTRSGSQVALKFKVQSADVASKVRSGGIKVKLNSGSFKLYMVSAKIVAYTPSTNTAETQVWPYNSWDPQNGQQFYGANSENDKHYGAFGNADPYSGAGAGSILRIYGYPTVDNGNWFIRPHTQWNVNDSKGLSFNGLAVGGEINPTNVSNFGSSTCITLVFNSSSASVLSTESGFGADIRNYYVTKVTFEKK